MNEEKIIQAIITLQDEVAEIKATIFTKEERKRMIETMDSMYGILKKTDQEHVFTTQRTNRIEKTVERHEEDIKQLKTAVLAA